MKRLPFVFLLVVALLFGSTGAVSADTRTDPLGTDRGSYAFGEEVRIEFVNLADDAVRMGKLWRITHLDTDEEVAFYQWPDDERAVRRYGTRTWTWGQLGPACYGECQNVSPGEQVEAGRYQVTMQVNGRSVSQSFTIGQYFTLGFEARPELGFTVFVATQPEIDEMTAEAGAEDKTLIVSGIVRKERDYNPGWNFSMGTRSIVLGESFVEVCDGSPHYVQRHRKDWLGERWCPWDSYVRRVGR